VVLDFKSPVARRLTAFEEALKITTKEIIRTSAVAPKASLNAPLTSQSFCSREVVARQDVVSRCSSVAVDDRIGEHAYYSEHRRCHGIPGYGTASPQVTLI
jgi:hypothetical protein